jgi:hypothetical protein
MPSLTLVVNEPRPPSRFDSGRVQHASCARRHPVFVPRIVRSPPTCVPIAATTSPLDCAGNHRGSISKLRSLCIACALTGLLIAALVLACTPVQALSSAQLIAPRPHPDPRQPVSSPHRHSHIDMSIRAADMSAAACSGAFMAYLLQPRSLRSWHGA